MLLLITLILPIATLQLVIIVWNGTTYTQSGVYYTYNYISTNKHNNSAITFNYTGSVQTYTVPAGVVSLNIQAYGAEGGSLGNKIINIIIMPI